MCYIVVVMSLAGQLCLDLQVVPCYCSWTRLSDRLGTVDSGLYNGFYLTGLRKE